MNISSQSDQLQTISEHIEDTTSQLEDPDIVNGNLEVANIADVVDNSDVLNDNNDLEEQLPLNPRISPIIPGPRQCDDNGWSSIWKFGAWKAFLVRFALLENVPEQHKAL